MKTMRRDDVNSIIITGVNRKNWSARILYRGRKWKGVMFYTLKVMEAI